VDPTGRGHLPNVNDSPAPNVNHNSQFGTTRVVNDSLTAQCERCFTAGHRMALWCAAGFTTARLCSAQHGPCEQTVRTAVAALPQTAPARLLPPVPLCPAPTIKTNQSDIVVPTLCGTKLCWLRGALRSCVDARCDGTNASVTRCRWLTPGVSRI
jgi:hypothetical protein